MCMDSDSPPPLPTSTTIKLTITSSCGHGANPYTLFSLSLSLSACRNCCRSQAWLFRASLARNTHLWRPHETQRRDHCAHQRH